jgi:hypothetical protein
VALRAFGQQALSSLEELGDRMRALTALRPLALVWGNGLSGYERLKRGATLITAQERPTLDQLTAVRRAANQVGAGLEQLRAWTERVIAARERLLAIQAEIGALPRLADEQAVSDIQRQALALDIANWRDEDGVLTLLQETRELPALGQQMTAALSKDSLPAQRAEPLRARCEAFIAARRSFPARLDRIRQQLQAIRQAERAAGLQFGQMLPALDVFGQLASTAGMIETITGARGAVDRLLHQGRSLQTLFNPTPVGAVLENAQSVQAWYAESATYCAELAGALVRGLQQQRAELQSALAAFRAGQFANEERLQEARTLEAELAQISAMHHGRESPERLAADAQRLAELYRQTRRAVHGIGALAAQMRTETHHFTQLMGAIEAARTELEGLVASPARPWPPLSSQNSMIRQLSDLLNDTITQIERAPTLDALAASRRSALDVAQSLQTAITLDRDRLRRERYVIQSLEQRFGRLRRRLQDFREEHADDSELSIRLEKRIAIISGIYDRIRHSARTFDEAAHDLETLLRDARTSIDRGGGARPLSIRQIGDDVVIE